MKKFRVWDKELKFYVDPLLYFIQLDGSIWFNLGVAADGEDSLIDQSFKLVVEQFTGLHDKNGKEIYEGDLLSNGVITLEVYYKTVNGSFAAKGKEHHIFPHKFKLFEVIGNIHENQELLSGE